MNISSHLTPCCWLLCILSWYHCGFIRFTLVFNSSSIDWREDSSGTSSQKTTLFTYSSKSISPTSCSGTFQMEGHLDRITVYQDRAQDTNRQPTSWERRSGETGSKTQTLATTHDSGIRVTGSISMPHSHFFYSALMPKTQYFGIYIDSTIWITADKHDAASLRLLE